MSSEKREWTLICYAGSASQASINSRPLGSELVVCVGEASSTRQVISSDRRRVRAKATLLKARKISLNHLDINKNSFMLSVPQNGVMARLRLQHDTFHLTLCAGYIKQKGPRRPRTLMSTGKFPILGSLCSAPVHQAQGRRGAQP
jgi:hypothetical protein